MMHESFTFYRSFYDAINLLSSPEEKIEAYDALFNYAFNGEEPKSASRNTSIILCSVKPQIDKSLERYGRLVELSKLYEKNTYYYKYNIDLKEKKCHKKRKKTQVDGENNLPSSKKSTNGKTAKSKEAIAEFDAKLKNAFAMEYTKFASAFPSKKNVITSSCRKFFKEIGIDTVKMKVNIDKLIEAVKNSDFLMERDYLGFWWCLTNYTRIVNEIFKTGADGKTIMKYWQSCDQTAGYKGREYSKAELESLFDSIDDLEVSNE